MGSEVEAEEQMDQVEHSTSSGWVSVEDSGTNTPKEVLEIDFVTLGMFIIGMLFVWLWFWFCVTFLLSRHFDYSASHCTHMLPSHHRTIAPSHHVFACFLSHPLSLHSLPFLHIAAWRESLGYLVLLLIYSG